MMTDSGIRLGEAVGRLMRRSVVRSWEPCAGVSGNTDTLHPVSSSRLQGFEMTHYRWLTPWTSCPSGGRLLAPMTETTPLAPSTAEAAAATERLAALVIGALTAIVIGGVALVIYVPHGGHAGGSSWLPEINASLNGAAADEHVPGAEEDRRRIAAHRACMIAAFAASSL